MPFPAAHSLGLALLPGGRGVGVRVRGAGAGAGGLCGSRSGPCSIRSTRPWRRSIVCCSSQNGELERSVQSTASGVDESEVESLRSMRTSVNSTRTSTSENQVRTSRVTRKTKIICTIGPATCTKEALFALADKGMNVARLNMSHGTHEWHLSVIDLVKEYNSLGRNTVAIMLDTKGPEVRTGDLKAPIKLNPGERFIFTVDRTHNRETQSNLKMTQVNYDSFANEAEIGDILLIDGGMLSMRVTAINGMDVETEVIDGGLLSSRRHLNTRGKTATMPSITEKDWADILFGAENGIDFVALSFVKDAASVRELKRVLARRGFDVDVIAKIEAADAINCLDSILETADGAMVARGDLGAELPMEEVPIAQADIVEKCRQLCKPVIVATHMIESMTLNPTPTRAEVSDIALAVREGADAIMLSGETAAGKYPHRSLEVMSSVARRAEVATESGSFKDPVFRPTAIIFRNTETFARHACEISDHLGGAIIVFTRTGSMARLLSHYRPMRNIYAFTDDEKTQRLLALVHGTVAQKIEFLPSADETIKKALLELYKSGLMELDERVTVVHSGRKPIWRDESTHTLEVRVVKSCIQ